MAMTRDEHGLMVTELTLYAGCLPGVPFRDLVAAARGAGFTSISMWPNIWFRAQHREGLTPAAMRSILDDSGVTVTDLDPCGDWLPLAPPGTPPFPIRNDMTRHQYFEIAATLGARAIVAVDLVGVPVSVDEAAEGFARLCDDAADHGLSVVLEGVVFTAIKDPAAAWAIVERAGRSNAGIMVDVAHHVRTGGDDGALHAIPIERIWGVQLCDGPAQPPANLLDEALFHRLLPGEGEFPLVGLLRLLGDMHAKVAVGPELYQRGFADERAIQVAARLMATTRRVLDRASAVVIGGSR